jgi:hypothetical protein
LSDDENDEYFEILQTQPSIAAETLPNNAPTLGAPVVKGITAIEPLVEQQMEIYDVGQPGHIMDMTSSPPNLQILPTGPSISPGTLPAADLPTSEHNAMLHTPCTHPAHTLHTPSTRCTHPARTLHTPCAPCTP